MLLFSKTQLNVFNNVGISWSCIVLYHSVGKPSVPEDFHLVPHLSLPHVRSSTFWSNSYLVWILTNPTPCLDSAEIIHLTKSLLATVGSCSIVPELLSSLRIHHTQLSQRFGSAVFIFRVLGTIGCKHCEFFGRLSCISESCQMWSVAFHQELSHWSLSLCFMPVLSPQSVNFSPTADIKYRLSI